MKDPSLSLGMTRRLAMTLLVLLAVVGVSACSKIAERAFTQPVITVRGVKLKSVGLTGGSIEVALTISNPNPYPLPVQRAVYAFALADSTPVGNGTTTVAFTLPARDSALVDLPVDVSWQGLRAAARDATGDGTVDYRFSGTVTLDTPLGDPNVTFETVGRFTPPPQLIRSFQ